MVEIYYAQGFGVLHEAVLRFLRDDLLHARGCLAHFRNAFGGTEFPVLTACAQGPGPLRSVVDAPTVTTTADFPVPRERVVKHLVDLILRSAT